MSKVNREIWDIYNVHGERQPRTILRGEPLLPGDYHLVVQIWIKNTKGEFLIQQRSENVKSLPGIWATTAGAVASGEDSITGALRELHEELGIEADAVDLQLIMHTKTADSLGTAWLLAKNVALDELILQEAEVSQVCWATPEAIKKMVAERLFYNYGDDYFNHVFSCQHNSAENT